MSELLATAQRLRTVKTAFQEFITLWAIDCLLDEPESSQRIAGDILREAELNEIHGMTGLYQGHRLDD